MLLRGGSRRTTDRIIIMTPAEHGIHGPAGLITLEMPRDARYDRHGCAEVAGRA